MTVTTARTSNEMPPGPIGSFFIPDPPRGPGLEPLGPDYHGPQYFPTAPMYLPKLPAPIHFDRFQPEAA